METETFSGEEGGVGRYPRRANRRRQQRMEEGGRG